MKALFFKFLIILFSTLFNAEAKVSSEVKVHEVEVLGRSVIINKNLKKARQLALDDALYLASLKGGAMIEGFSSVSNSTILNDQSIVKATSNILDFKILSEKQKDEHFEIKILAVVGFNQPKSKCTSKPLNITVFKGQIFSDHSLPSNLLRSMYKWYDGFYEIIKSQKNLKIYDKSDLRLKDIIQSSVNKEYDYNAVVNGLPEVKEGNFSLVPRFEISSLDTQYNFENQHKVANYKITLNFYKGPSFKFYKKMIIQAELPYKYISKFQFISSNFTKRLKELNSLVRKKTLIGLKSMVNDFNCTPLEGVIEVNNDKLFVDIGKSQGLYNRQIGIIKSNFNNSFLKKSQNIVLYVSDVNNNKSRLIPLNDNVDITQLNKMKIQFVE